MDGDTSDPCTPLNYAHGEPNAVFQNHQPSVSLTSPPPSADSVATTIANQTASASLETSNLLQLWDNSSASWPSSYGDISLTQYKESSLKTRSTLNFHPTHPDRHSFIATPNESSINSHQSHLQIEVGGIDQPMLEIDWKAFGITSFPRDK
ncbi:hypothetical protein N7488_004717 [Penicillium malachiteum]|nr:hypothetical protein N7488_004717 [Penicillium malachiteum]